MGGGVRPSQPMAQETTEPLPAGFLLVCPIAVSTAMQDDIAALGA